MSARTAGVKAIPAALVLLALAIRLPYIVRVGPSEGGGDEWYSAWRSFAVLAERGNPGNFLHPALYYDAGALMFLVSGRVHGLINLLAQFVRDETRFLRELEYLSAAFGAATVGVTYALAKRMFGEIAGVIAGVLLAVLPLHIEYSQRARVDGLFVLCVTACGLALVRLDERGRPIDSILAGIAAGLATAANYPGVLLLAPLVWVHVRTRGGKGIRMAGGAILVAILAFVAANPVVISEPGVVLDGVRFQSSMAWHVHPYREGVSPAFYPSTLLAQGKLFCVASLAALVWAVSRGGLVRVFAICAAGWIALFAMMSTQFDRYVLPPLPFLCVLVGGLVSMAGRFGRAAQAAPIFLAALVSGESAWASRDRIAPKGIWESNPRAERQNWLLDHVTSGSTVWLEADLQPLLQATFADPGGELQQDFQQAFREVHPAFNAKFIKGERVERSASFEPSLVTDRKIQYALSCDQFDEYGHRDAQGAFYDALKSQCHKVFSTQDGCWIVQCL